MNCTGKLGLCHPYHCLVSNNVKKQLVKYNVLINIKNIFLYKICSLCKSNAISKVLNKLQAFLFRSTVHTNTTPTYVITHPYELQKTPFCNNNSYQARVQEFVRGGGGPKI